MKKDILRGENGKPVLNEILTGEDLGIQENLQVEENKQVEQEEEIENNNNLEIQKQQNEEKENEEKIEQYEMNQNIEEKNDQKQKEKINNNEYQAQDQSNPKIQEEYNQIENQENKDYSQEKPQEYSAQKINNENPPKEENNENITEQKVEVQKEEINNKNNENMAEQNVEVLNEERNDENKSEQHINYDNNNDQEVYHPESEQNSKGPIYQEESHQNEKISEKENEQINNYAKCEEKNNQQNLENFEQENQNQRPMLEIKEEKQDNLQTQPFEQQPIEPNISNVQQPIEPKENNISNVQQPIEPKESNSSNEQQPSQSIVEQPEQKKTESIKYQEQQPIQSSTEQQNQNFIPIKSIVIIKHQSQNKNPYFAKLVQTKIPSIQKPVSVKQFQEIQTTISTQPIKPQNQQSIQGPINQGINQNRYIPPQQQFIEKKIGKKFVKNNNITNNNQIQYNSKIPQGKEINIMHAGYKGKRFHHPPHEHGPHGMHGPHGPFGPLNHSKTYYPQNMGFFPQGQQRKNEFVGTKRIEKSKIMNNPMGNMSQGIMTHPKINIDSKRIGLKSTNPESVNLSKQNMNKGIKGKEKGKDVAFYGYKNKNINKILCPECEALEYGNDYQYNQTEYYMSKTFKVNKDLNKDSIKYCSQTHQPKSKGFNNYNFHEIVETSDNSKTYILVKKSGVVVSSS